jgi:hypothetical protein
LEVNGGCRCFLSEKKVVKHFLQCHVFAQSPPGRHPNDRNIQPTVRTAPDFCKNVSLTVLFDRKDNSYTVSTQSGMRMYTHILYNLDTQDGQKNKKEKLRQQLKPLAVGSSALV